LLQDEQRLPQKGRLLQIIRENAQRLERMVHDVLELAKRDRVQPETIRLLSYLTTFVDEFARNENMQGRVFAWTLPTISPWNSTGCT